MTARRRIDADFLALPRHELADAALSAALAAGASHADLRVHRITTEIIQVRDRELETSVITREIGLAVRVIVDGTWGFASHAELDPGGGRRDRASCRAGGDDAGAPERRTHRTGGRAGVPRRQLDVELRASILSTSPRQTRSACSMSTRPGCSPATASTMCRPRLHTVKEQTFYADTLGSSITQQRVRVMPTLEAITVDAAAGTFDTMRTLAPPTARGWEAVAGDDVWDWSTELAQLPALLAEKVKAPSVVAGPTDLVIDPIEPLADHSRIHRARHRIRPRDRLRSRLRGHVVRDAGQARHDAVRVPGDERDGRPDRRLRIGDHRFRRRGGARAELGSGARRRVRRLSTRPRVRAAARGGPLQRLFVRGFATPRADPADGQRVAAAGARGHQHRRPDRPGAGRHLRRRDKSWSIDMQRYNFQFTGQRFFRIRDGRLDGQVRDVAYQATTTDFWGALEAVGGQSTWRLGGAFNCGKAQPGQVAPVSHGCPSALFRGINVLNTREESRPMISAPRGRRLGARRSRPAERSRRDHRAGHRPRRRRRCVGPGTR